MRLLEVIPDLIEVGIEALNSQVFCMGVEELGKEFAGRITFWGEVDRQRILSDAEPEEVEKAVFHLWEELFRDGGVIAQCEFGLRARPENVRKVFETWEAISRTRLGGKK